MKQSRWGHEAPPQFVLPYTRLAVGHGDYTPLGYTIPGPSTWAHGQVDLSFLGSGRYRGVLLTSPSPKEFARRELENVGSDTALALHAAIGDGAVLWLIQKP